MAPPNLALTAQRWRTRRSAAVAGILFGILLTAALVIFRLAVPEGGPSDISEDSTQRQMIRLALALVPFAGIAFLWFIGVIRDQVGQVEDRLFSTVFLGSGLLFLAMLFVGAVLSTALLELASGPGIDPGLWDFGRSVTQTLVSVYAMRMAAVFTLSVSSLALRTGAVPRWVAFLGFAVGLVLLVTASRTPWTQLAFPLWVLLLSVVLLVRSPDRAPRAAPPA